MALTHTPVALLDHADAPGDQAPRRLPRQSRAAAPVLGVTAMAAALGATAGLTSSAAAAEPAPAAVSAPDADPGLALAARIQQQADPARAAADEAAEQAARAEAEQAARTEAARLEAAQEAAAKRAAAQQPAARQLTERQAPAEEQSADTVLPLPGRPVDLPAATPWPELRTGVDISAPVGTPVRAVAAGTVTAAGWSGGYGYRVIQTLPDGTEVWYCHLSAITAAGPLAPGEALGRVGATGSRTGTARLHLEVRPGGGAPVDAAAWFQARGLAL
ncbi:M23 family metallopeptidase [Kitasatospora sp. NPDC006697]|uniref:M23 family metallopeptidase n=1 Tax=Kitasatospora sp. NPDC006697 TaxID=3364020 RepID=UPI003678F91D